MKKPISFLSVFAVLVLVCGPRLSWASPEVDRKFSLSRVGVLRSVDNVDGLFADYVSVAFQEYFRAQSRFTLVDLTKADAILTQSNKTSYADLIGSNAVLAQVARSLRAESLIRTRVTKEGPNYRFLIEWLHAPKMDLLANETLIINQPEAGKNLGFDELKGSLQMALERMIKKLPFMGQVTGRDQEAVTLDIGRSSGVQPKDEVTVSTLEEVKRHPLSGLIVDWQMEQTGKILIDTVDEGISFGRVIEEESQRPVARFNKVVSIRNAPKPKSEIPTTDADDLAARAQEPPRMGYGRLGVFGGVYSRDYSTGAGTGKTGTALMLGPTAEGQLWFTREFFAELGFGYGFSSYSQKDIAAGSAATASTAVSASMFRSQFSLGYSYSASPFVFGPKAFAKLGFQSTSFSLPISASEFTGPSKSSGLFLGVGGELPIRGPAVAVMNFDFGIINSASAKDFITASTISSQYVQFFLGGIYRYEPRMSFRFGVNVLGTSADFSDSTSLSQKVISIGPDFIFYF